METINRLYIIDPSDFKGIVINTMSSSMYVDYMDKPTTFEEYKVLKNNPNLVALTWEVFLTEHYDPYLKGRQKPFKKVSKEMFWDALECLPPKRWTIFEGGEFFFVGECTTADLYDCYVRKGDDYFAALRGINTSKEDIINMINIV